MPNPITKAQQKYLLEMMGDLDELQDALCIEWLDNSIPSEWDTLYETHPLPRPKTRVTLRLDTDMVKWFRKLGPRYGERINAILRVYVGSLKAGYISEAPNTNAAFLRFKEYRTRLREHEDRMRAERNADNGGQKILFPIDKDGNEIK